MRNLLGWLFVLCGVCLGAYVGLYLMLWGGVMDIVVELRADELSEWNLFLGFLKFSFGGFVGGAIYMIGNILGTAVAKD